MQIDWWTLALQAANFLVLVWLLQRFLFRPIRQVIAKRREREQNALKAATEAEAEAESVKQRYEQDVAGVEQERHALLKKAQESAEAERSKLLEATRQEIEKARSAAEERLEEERQRVLEHLQGELSQAAVRMAAALLTKSGARMDAKEILDALVRQLRDLPPEERQRINNDMKISGIGPRIVTAAALLPKEQKQWGEALEAVLAQPCLNPSFEVDPKVLGGAELHFPHSVLKFSWKDQLTAIGEDLLSDETAHR